jgi:uncharacterized protein (TIGR02118 family)
MIKLCYALRRRSELSREEFQRYWLEEHAPLVESVQADLRLQRYVQVHTFLDAGGNPNSARGKMDDAPDGVAELWWESMDDLQAAMATPEGQRADALLAEDEAKFIDFTRSSRGFGNIHEIVGG